MQGSESVHLGSAVFNRYAQCEAQSEQTTSGSFCSRSGSLRRSVLGREVILIHAGWLQVGVDFWSFICMAGTAKLTRVSLQGQLGTAVIIF